VDDAVGGDVSWEGWLEGGRKGRGFGIGDRVDGAFEGCRAERGGYGGRNGRDGLEGGDWGGRGEDVRGVVRLPRNFMRGWRW
jgi:hypothetical protein